MRVLAELDDEEERAVMMLLLFFECGFCLVVCGRGQLITPIFMRRGGMRFRRER
jgi:hypothetical protein